MPLPGCVCVFCLWKQLLEKLCVHSNQTNRVYRELVLRRKFNFNNSRTAYIPPLREEFLHRQCYAYLWVHSSWIWKGLGNSDLNNTGLKTIGFENKFRITITNTFIDLSNYGHLKSLSLKTHGSKNTSIESDWLQNTTNFKCSWLGTFPALKVMVWK